MKIDSKNDYKISIKYNSYDDSWNTFVNYLISFMIESNVAKECFKDGAVLHERDS